MPQTFCLLSFLLSSRWPVVYLASCHWLVPNLLLWEALWPTFGKEEEEPSEKMTHGRLFAEFKAKGVVVPLQVNSEKCFKHFPLFCSSCC